MNQSQFQQNHRALIDSLTSHQAQAVDPSAGFIVTSTVSDIESKIYVMVSIPDGKFIAGGNPSAAIAFEAMKHVTQDQRRAYYTLIITGLHYNAGNLRISSNSTRNLNVPPVRNVDFTLENTIYVNFSKENKYVQIRMSDCSALITGDVSGIEHLTLDYAGITGGYKFPIHVTACGTAKRSLAGFTGVKTLIVRFTGRFPSDSSGKGDTHGVKFQNFELPPNLVNLEVIRSPNGSRFNYAVNDGKFGVQEFLSRANMDSLRFIKVIGVSIREMPVFNGKLENAVIGIHTEFSSEKFIERNGVTLRHIAFNADTLVTDAEPLTALEILELNGAVLIISSIPQTVKKLLVINGSKLHVDSGENVEYPNLTALLCHESALNCGTKSLTEMFASLKRIVIFDCDAAKHINVESRSVKRMRVSGCGGLELVTGQFTAFLRGENFEFAVDPDSPGTGNMVIEGKPLLSWRMQKHGDVYEPLFKRVAHSVYEVQPLFSTVPGVCQLHSSEPTVNRTALNQ